MNLGDVDTPGGKLVREFWDRAQMTSVDLAKRIDALVADERVKCAEYIEGLQAEIWLGTDASSLAAIIRTGGHC